MLPFFLIASDPALDAGERGNLLFHRDIVRLLRSFHSLAMTIAHSLLG